MDSDSESDVNLDLDSEQIPSFLQLTFVVKGSEVAKGVVKEVVTRSCDENKK